MKADSRSRVARTIAILYLVIAWVIAATALLPEHETAAVSAPVAPASATSSPLYPVVHVVDGDTIDVMDGGKKVRVRLIGIDTPETVDPKKSVQCYGPEASAEMERIISGMSVRLETDPTQARYDKYGRLLAYVFLADGTPVNLHMIATGFAREYTYNTPYTYQAQFRSAQMKAQSAGLGLWGVCRKR